MSMFRLFYLNRQRRAITNAIIYGKLEEFLHSWHCHTKRLLSIGLRTVPTFVTVHTFCASRDTRVSYRWCLLIQGYFCAF